VEFDRGGSEAVADETEDGKGMEGARGVEGARSVNEKVWTIEAG
jgi:hypothetical protein